MKVLHLSTFDSQRGAAIATKRLHEALLAKGINSLILCDLPSGDTPNSIGLREKQNWLMDRLRARWNGKLKSLQADPDIYFLSLNMRRNRLLAKVDALKPDIVHIHWVGLDFLRVEDLPRLCNKYPVVWTLHDMWPFCGAEHIAYSEERWRYGYTKENRSPHARGVDLNRWVWRRKLKSWTGCTLHTISVSTWMDECLQQSKLFQGIKGIRRVVPNGVDMNIFKPRDTMHKNSYPKLIYMSPPPVANKIKGVELFVQTMNVLHTQNIKLDITTFGGPPIPDLPSLGNIRNTGQIDSAVELAELYASADLLVTASRMESFGQTAAEALACGTPVACFDTSGLRDIVKHKQNGYRAKCFSPESLAEGINWCLADPKRYKELQAQARPSVADRFRIDTTTAQTIAFYEEIKVNVYREYR